MNNKGKLVRIVVGAGMAVAVLIVFFIINDTIKNNRRRTFKFAADSDAYAYQVEELSVEGNEVVIKGWFFELKSTHNVLRDKQDVTDLGIILYDINKEQEFDSAGAPKPPKGEACSVERVTRTDVNDYFKCEFDYSNCGFIAKINKSDINLEKGQYEIIFKFDQETFSGDGLLSNTYIDRGKLKYINPQDEVSLDVQGTDLEKIVSDGICMFNNPDYNVYVYQYEKKIYWIAEEGFLFQPDGGTRIQYRMDTTQFNKLPEDSVKKGWFRSDLTDSFEAHEITDTINCGKYRVSVRDIPEEYSVYWMETGYYLNEQWIWQRFFRPQNLYK